MKTTQGLLAVTLCLVSFTQAQARSELENTAVYSKVFNDYTRTPSPAGGYRAETFAFANGGPVTSRYRDASLDQATFNQIIRLISPELTRQNYIAAGEAEDTDLVIFVHWGATDGYDTPSNLTNGTYEQAANQDDNWYGAASRMDDDNRQRDRRNFSNAGLLGYREGLARHIAVRDMGIHGTIYQDMIADVEEPRYFVVLTAFDFKHAWKGKKLVPLWSTRYNIPTRGNNFTAALPDMTRFASRYFGRDSGGLVRRLNPTGKVEMGDFKVLGTVETTGEEK